MDLFNGLLSEEERNQLVQYENLFNSIARQDSIANSTPLPKNSVIQPNFSLGTLSDLEVVSGLHNHDGVDNHWRVSESWNHESLAPVGPDPPMIPFYNIDEDTMPGVSDSEDLEQNRPSVLDLGIKTTTTTITTPTENNFPDPVVVVDESSCSSVSNFTPSWVNLIENDPFPLYPDNQLITDSEIRYPVINDDATLNSNPPTFVDCGYHETYLEKSPPVSFSNQTGVLVFNPLYHNNGNSSNKKIDNNQVKANQVSSPMTGSYSSIVDLGYFTDSPSNEQSPPSCPKAGEQSSSSSSSTSSSLVYDFVSKTADDRHFWVNHLPFDEATQNTDQSMINTDVQQVQKNKLRVARGKNVSGSGSGGAKEENDDDYVQRFRCPFAPCFRVFPRKSQLKVHMRMHTGLFTKSLNLN